MARIGFTLIAALVLVEVGPARAGFPKVPLTKCADDAVVAGTVCLDRYEASVWRVPNASTTNAKLVKKIQLGKATQALLVTGGATQLGVLADDYAPCDDNGQHCVDDIYAVSLPGVQPSYLITWFQAQEACANSGKRLPTNAEWQVGANGTPDPGGDNGTTDCNSASLFHSATGSRSACVSARGAFDMVGNMDEWVADWVPRSIGLCPGWGPVSNDDMCLMGASVIDGPGALTRGGHAASGTRAGPFTVDGGQLPSTHGIGFRCAR
jgi:formylglycine-generating enzyme required for sulfatase activity